MKLSTAIRKGVARDGKQVFGNYFERDNNDYEKIIGCCALGAAMIGAKPSILKGADRPLIEESFPKAAKPVVACPSRGCKGDEDGVFLTVAHLNDHHKWKRERIADWLEGIGL